MRILALAACLSLLAGCSLDSSGSGATEDLPDDDANVSGDAGVLPDTSLSDSGSVPEDTSVPFDTFVPDTFVPDTFVRDTFVPDTFVPDTFVPDTFVPDTFVPDTFVPDTARPDAGVDAAPPCSEANSGTYYGHCYWLVASGVSWTTARNACAAASTTGHPAHLAVITTVGEWSFVNGLPGGGSYGRWIGLSSTAASSMKSAFKWITSEPFAYDAWMSGHPNGSGGCVVMHSPGFSPPGSWEDVSCSATYLYVCERE